MFVDSIWWAEETIADPLRASESSLREVGNNDWRSLFTASHKSTNTQASCNMKHNKEKKSTWVYWNPSSTPNSCWRGLKMEIRNWKREIGTGRQCFYLWIRVRNILFFSWMCVAQLFGVNTKKIRREPVRRRRALISVSIPGIHFAARQACSVRLQICRQKNKEKNKNIPLSHWLMNRAVKIEV